MKDIKNQHNSNQTKVIITFHFLAILSPQ